MRTGASKSLCESLSLVLFEVPKSERVTAKITCLQILSINDSDMVDATAQQ
jgi:hypothetical protein